MSRILCLHGHGSSSRVLEAQMTGIRTLLPRHYELVFAEGEIVCGKSSGIPSHFPGPFYCFLENYTCTYMASAHEFLEEVLDLEGPFDGVIGLSQGAGLVISYLLDLKRRDPLGSPPFRFAVFFSPAGASSSDMSYCEKEIASITDSELRSIKYAVKSWNQDGPTTQQKIGRVGSAPDIFEDRGQNRKEIFQTSVISMLRAGLQNNALSVETLREFDERQDKSTVPRPFHPALLTERITIPVVYTTGVNEHHDFLEQSETLRHLFLESRIQHFVHGGGHEPPKEISEIERLLKAIAWADEQSRRQHM